MAATLKAYGAVLWRGDADAPEVAVVHRPAYDDWTLPKGKPLAGEHPWQTAVREVEEETGSRGALGRRLADVRYDLHGRPKRVRYWAARLVREGGFAPGAEVDGLRWLPVAEARAVLTYGGERAVLDGLGRLDTTEVLLVRHGRAGDPDAWPGEDALRPLDAAGEQQAAAVGAVLPAFAPGRVLSADVLRCVETVRPLGLPVEDEPLFGEGGYWGARRKARECLDALGASGITTVVGSQGGVIPDLVHALTGAPQPVPARKGSVWVLSFAGGRVTGSEYAERLTAPRAPR